MNKRLNTAKWQCQYIEWCVTDGYEIPYAEYADLMELMYTTTPEKPHGGLSGQELIKVSEIALRAFSLPNALPPKPPKAAIRCTFSVSYAEGAVSMLKNGEVLLHAAE